MKTCTSVTNNFLPYSGATARLVYLVTVGVRIAVKKRLGCALNGFPQRFFACAVLGASDLCLIMTFLVHM